MAKTIVHENILLGTVCAKKWKEGSHYGKDYRS